MNTLRELNNYCILNARNILIKNGKLTGFGRDYNTKLFNGICKKHKFKVNSNCIFCESELINMLDNWK